MEDFLEETTPAQTLSNSETPKRVEGDVHVAGESTETSKRVEGADGGTPTLGLLRDGVEDPETDEPAVKKPCFDLQEVPREEDEDKWLLPEELAVHFSNNSKRHTTDKDMLSFMKEYPTPSNIDCVPRLDESAKRSLKDKNLNPTIDIDDDFAAIQKKVQDIMGPLGAAWGMLKL